MKRNNSTSPLIPFRRADVARVMWTHCCSVWEEEEEDGGVRDECRQLDGLESPDRGPRMTVMPRERFLASRVGAERSGGVRKFADALADIENCVNGSGDNGKGQISRVEFTILPVLLIFLFYFILGKMGKSNPLCPMSPSYSTVSSR